MVSIESLEALPDITDLGVRGEAAARQVGVAAAKSVLESLVGNSLNTVSRIWAHAQDSGQLTARMWTWVGVRAMHWLLLSFL